MALTSDGEVLWVEAANRFDIYAFTEAAKVWGLNPQPFLRRLHIARAFTLHQLGALCADGLQAAIRQHPNALTILSEPLALCWDAEVPLSEARRVVRKIVAGIQRVGHSGHRLVVTCRDVPEAFRSRAALADLLRPVATRRASVRALETGVLLIDAESRAAPQLTVGM